MQVINCPQVYIIPCLVLIIFKNGKKKANNFLVALIILKNGNKANNFLLHYYVHHTEFNTPPTFVSVGIDSGLGMSIVTMVV